LSAVEARVIYSSDCYSEVVAYETVTYEPEVVVYKPEPVVYKVKKRYKPKKKVIVYDEYPSRAVYYYTTPVVVEQPLYLTTACVY